MTWIHTGREETPNDPKLSDSGARRGSCEGGARKEATDVGQSHDQTGWVQVRIAATVTRGAVRCSAWLGAFVASSDVVVMLMSRSWQRECQQEERCDSRNAL